MDGGRALGELAAEGGEEGDGRHARRLGLLAERDDGEGVLGDVVGVEGVDDVEQDRGVVAVVAVVGDDRLEVVVGRIPADAPQDPRDGRLAEADVRRSVDADLGRNSAIQRRFNVGVPRAVPEEKTPTLRDRSERRSLVEESADTSGKRPREERFEVGPTSHPVPALTPTFRSSDAKGSRRTSLKQKR